MGFDIFDIPPQTQAVGRGGAKNSIYDGYLLISNFNRHNTKKVKSRYTLCIYIKKENKEKVTNNKLIIAFYNWFWHVFIFWNRCMITSLSMLWKMSFSMCIIKLLFFHWSLIQLRNQFFTIFLPKNALSTVVVTINKVNIKLTNK